MFFYHEYAKNCVWINLPKSINSTLIETLEKVENHSQHDFYWLLYMHSNVEFNVQLQVVSLAVNNQYIANTVLDVRWPGIGMWWGGEGGVG